MKRKYKILFTAVNIGASAIIYYGLESGSVLLPFITAFVLVMFDGAVLDIWEELLKIHSLL